jgi:type IV secretory pathway TrbL component
MLMASVTFDTALGGDGSTISDGTNPNTGLANDGHRLRFVPALEQMVAITRTAVDNARDAYAARLKATEAASQAQGAQTAAQSSASTATTAAESAAASAQQAAAYYASVALALENTESGHYFQVAENGYVQLYLNDGGAAKPVLKMASQEALDQLNARPDPLLTSLLF